MSQWHYEEHEQKKSALRGISHTPIYLAMTIATQIGVCKRKFTRATDKHYDPTKSRVIIIITSIQGQIIMKGTINLVKDAVH